MGSLGYVTATLTKPSPALLRNHVLHVCGSSTQQIQRPRAFLVSYGPTAGVLGLVLTACEPVFQRIPATHVTPPPGFEHVLSTPPSAERF